MARQTRGVRVLGPYPYRRQWRIVVVDEQGEKHHRYFGTEKDARQTARSLNRELGIAIRTIEEAIGEYEVYLRNEKQNKPRSVADAVYRLRLFFDDPKQPIDERPLDDLVPETCASYYQALLSRNTRLGKAISVDTHRTALAGAKTFGRWCVKKGWLRGNPLEEVEGIGRRRHGKAQLRLDEARRWLARATELADGGEAGAVAAMMALVMGMRASEIVGRVVRDLDDVGRLFWIPDSKTEAGRRTLEVPESIRPYLLRLAHGRGGEERLFGHHWRDWVRKWVRRICREAGVPVVTAHGMRGLHSTLAVDTGITAHAVAAALGHESSRTTFESYARPEAVSAASQRRVLKVLKGGAA